MKLTFKDLKQRKIEIEVDPSETIQAVKEKLKEKEGWEPSTQKLIYSGKILQDEKTVESYKIDEKGWVVCMIQKPKAAPKPAAEPATPAKPASTPAAPSAPTAATTSTGAAAVPSTPTPAAPSTTGAAAAAAAADPQSFNDPSALAMGEQRAAAIASMEGMGFPRDQIDRAMRAAFYNPDRAVEYLLNGIPESAQQEQAAAQQAQQTASPAAGGGNTGGATAPAAAAAAAAVPTATETAGGDEGVNLFEAAAQRGAGGNGGGAGGRPGSNQGGAGAGAGAGGQGAGAGAGAGGAGDLEFLRNFPQFQQLRQVVQQQPQMLEPILQQVAAGNPQLAQIINQNPEEFMRLLAEDVDEDVALPPGVQQISVTEEEREAIERLCRLGFARDDVIQAYFACDKNEELAANFLFEQPDEGDDAGGNNNS